MPRDSVDELFGCDELSSMLGEDELEGIFDTIGKLASGAVKGVAKAAKGAVGIVKKALDSPVGKVLMPVTSFAQSKTARAIGEKIPVIGEVYKKADAAMGMVNKLAGSGSTAKKTTASSGTKKSIFGGLKIAPKVVAKTQAAAAKVGTTPLSTAVKQAAAKKVAAVKAASASAPVMAAAAPVPMAQQQAPTTVVVQPYGGPPKPSARDIIAKLDAEFGGQLATVANQVRLMNLQNQATSEHRGKLKEETFRRDLVSMLRDIATNTGSR